MADRKVPPRALQAILRARQSGATYHAIADRYGVTREWIRQILKRLGAAGRLPRLEAPPKKPRQFRNMLAAVRNRAILAVGGRVC